MPFGYSDVPFPGVGSPQSKQKQRRFGISAYAREMDSLDNKKNMFNTNILLTFKLWRKITFIYLQIDSGQRVRKPLLLIVHIPVPFHPVAVQETTSSPDKSYPDRQLIVATEPKVVVPL